MAEERRAPQGGRRVRRRASGGDDGSRDVAPDSVTGPDATAGEPDGGSTPAPDPLQNAMPDVDQAILAEAGVGRGPSGDVDGPAEVEAEPPSVDPVDEPAAEEFEPDSAEDYERAPDEVENDLVPVRRASANHPAAEPGEVVAGRPRRTGTGPIAFLGHCADELRRVQWPDRQQVGQATAVVLGFTLIAGGYLGLIDAVLQPLVNWAL